MANHKSCEKRARQTKIKTERNRFYKTRIKNVTKNVLAAIEGADKEKAVEAMKAANKY
ncbi:MAG: 30S ribosomal protein S20, partial [Arcobacter sp.]|nr:30S ribosomal protein S20 [Arcobacter sp.]